MPNPDVDIAAACPKSPDRPLLKRLSSAELGPGSSPMLQQAAAALSKAQIKVEKMHHKCVACLFVKLSARLSLIDHPFTPNARYVLCFNRVVKPPEKTGNDDNVKLSSIAGTKTILSCWMVAHKFRCKVSFNT